MALFSCKQLSVLFRREVSDCRLNASGQYWRVNTIIQSQSLQIQEVHEMAEASLSDTIVLKSKQLDYSSIAGKPRPSYCSVGFCFIFFKLAPHYVEKMSERLVHVIT